jgi:hypothetical protein
MLNYLKESRWDFLSELNNCGSDYPIRDQLYDSSSPRRIGSSNDDVAVSDDCSFQSEPWFSYNMNTGEIILATKTPKSVQRWPLPVQPVGLVKDFHGNIYNPKSGQFLYHIADN